MTRALLVSFFALAALFLAFSGIDVWFASLFYDGERFPLGRSVMLEDLRNAIWTAVIFTAAGALILWLTWLPLGRRAIVPPRLWGWAVLVFVVGPGLLVNALLKEHWGRARPSRVLSGRGEFSPPFVIADECQRNCSFVSGEAAGAAAMAIVLGAVFWRVLAPAGRRRLVILLVVVAGAAGLMRTMTGRHFLSDVIFAAYFVALIALALWHLMRIGPARDALSLRTVRADLRALGSMIGRRWRRVVGS